MTEFNFNDNWTFRKKGDSAAMPITLPHDAMIHTCRTPAAPGGSAQGYFSGGSYCYEKKFVLPADWEGKPVKLQFEGVYKNAQVFVNDREKGGAAYGYIPFWVDCGILPAGENTVTVLCENEKQPDSRWYSGAGIYRPVHAWVGEGFTPEDIKVTTLSVHPPRIEVTARGEEVSAEIYDGNTMIAAGCGVLELPAAKLWSAEAPYLYTCKVGDTEVKFGIRKIEWSNRGLFVNGKEVLLRGGCVHHDSGILGAATYDESEWRRVKILKDAGYNAIRSAHNPASRALLDACDFYGLYVMDETWDMWYHHKSPGDYAGQWREHYRQDIKALTARDYNHPSVLMYSVGNEVSEPAQEEGVRFTQEMVRLFHEQDSTRPVTGGFNLMIIANAQKGKGIYDDENGGRKNDKGNGFGGMNSTLFNMITGIVGTGMNKAANSKKADSATSPALDSLDIAGYNYASGRYPLEGKAHPDRVIFGSETFPQDIAKNWEMVQKYPYLVGDFMWTAWDYLGEAGIGAWAYTPDGRGFNKPYPWLLADTGAFDILGVPNGEAFLAQAAWRTLPAPKIAVRPVNHPGVTPAKASWRGTNAIPSWSWQGCEGNKAIVEVYFACAKAELFLNGKSLGKKAVKNCKAVFKTKYIPGKLEAAAYDESGREIARSALVSAQEVKIQPVPEKRTAAAGEVLYVPVTLGDGALVESNADRKLIFTVKNGELLAFGSANPRTEERFDTGSYTTYYGHALAVVRAGSAGVVRVCVTDGRQTETAEIRIEED